MGNEKTPKLPLTDQERDCLRKNKIRLSAVKNYKEEELAKCLKISQNRAKELIALALFQAIPSIGPKLANWVVIDLGYHSFEEIRNCRGEDLTLELEKYYGVWMDPCVEDSIRCIVHHANHPGSKKNWWDFTEERKAYREKHGYPSDRPSKAWHE
ncbi:helix-hairpin-helix domain-containing protein [Metabacillus arenae]|uniref:Pathogenicity locus n=1 Tax=Metabacillus arenae TaxID=2771434 RepID=A0A926NK01_9BACI|nr:helix-hairpin-helix domain-containing protein [Metabacillus arenae]MBD1382170.1 Pathogenicity locus [Metabacillus arenae]